MRGKLLIVLIISVIPFKLFSQIDQEIKAYVDSSEVIVQQGRRLMLKELNDNNLAKTREIYEYPSIGDIPYFSVAIVFGMGNF